MEDAVRRLNAEYGFNLTEEEIRLIAKRVEQANRLFQPLFEVDLTGLAPMLKLDRKRPIGDQTKKKTKRARG